MLKEHHQQIAALVIEPLVQCAAGIIVHPPGYLQGIRELCTKYEVLLIADEVAVGFGRTGKMFACQHEQVTPDFLCLAKGITGGYMPLAATLTTDEIWNAFLGTYAESKSFFHGHTYGGNPLGAAVALANLKIFEEEQTLKAIQPKIARLKEHLARIAQHNHVGDVRQCGLIAGIELVRDKARKEPYPWEQRRGWQVCESAMADGVLLRPLGNVVVIMPPLAIKIEELDRICAAVERGIEKATSKLTVVAHCAEDFVPWSDPPISTPTGSGRPAVAYPKRCNSSLSCSYWAKLSGYVHSVTVVSFGLWLPSAQRNCELADKRLVGSFAHRHAHRHKLPFLGAHADHAAAAFGDQIDGVTKLKPIARPDHAHLVGQRPKDSTPPIACWIAHLQ